MGEATLRHAVDDCESVLEGLQSQIIIDEGRNYADHTESHPVTAVVQSILHEDTHNVSLSRKLFKIKNPHLDQAPPFYILETGKNEPLEVLYPGTV